MNALSHVHFHRAVIIAIALALLTLVGPVTNATAGIEPSTTVVINEVDFRD